MKEMVYSDDECWVEDLDKGKYLGYHYLVRSYGTHPCCYISIPNGEAIDTVSLPCHGGVTYCEDVYPYQEEATDGFYWIGWDYAHAGDYQVYSYANRGKKWTTEELVQDCKDVIEAVDEILAERSIDFVKENYPEAYDLIMKSMSEGESK